MSMNPQINEELKPTLVPEGSGNIVEAGVIPTSSAVPVAEGATNMINSLNFNIPNSNIPPAGITNLGGVSNMAGISEIGGATNVIGGVPDLGGVAGVNNIGAISGVADLGGVAGVTNIGGLSGVPNIDGPANIGPVPGLADITEASLAGAGPLEGLSIGHTNLTEVRDANGNRISLVGAKMVSRNVGQVSKAVTNVKDNIIPHVRKFMDAQETSRDREIYKSVVEYQTKEEVVPIKKTYVDYVQKEQIVHVKKQFVQPVQKETVVPEKRSYVQPVQRERVINVTKTVYQNVPREKIVNVRQPYTDYVQKEIVVPIKKPYIDYVRQEKIVNVRQPYTEPVQREKIVQVKQPMVDIIRKDAEVDVKHKFNIYTTKEQEVKLKQRKIQVILVQPKIVTYAQDTNEIVQVGAAKVVGEATKVVSKGIEVIGAPKVIRTRIIGRKKLAGAATAVGAASISAGGIAGGISEIGAGGLSSMAGINGIAGEAAGLGGVADIATGGVSSLAGAGSIVPPPGIVSTSIEKCGLPIGSLSAGSTVANTLTANDFTGLNSLIPNNNLNMMGSLNGLGALQGAGSIVNNGEIPGGLMNSNGMIMNGLGDAAMGIDMNNLNSNGFYINKPDGMNIFQLNGSGNFNNSVVPQSLSNNMGFDISNNKGINFNMAKSWIPPTGNIQL